METEQLNTMSFVPSQYGINDDEMRTFKCWGSVEVVDRKREIIPAEEVYKIMDIWMDRGAPIMLRHSNKSVGRGLNWQPLEKNGNKGVLVTGKIYKHYKDDDTVWEGIKNGAFEGLSIGGKAFSKEPDGEGNTILRNLTGYEFSLVDRTGNQEATFMEVNAMAKSDDLKKEDPPVIDPASPIASAGNMAKLESMVYALIDKVAKIEEKISGGPQTEAPVEEQKSDTVKETVAPEAPKTEEAPAKTEETSKEEAPKTEEAPKEEAPAKADEESPKEKAPEEKPAEKDKEKEDDEDVKKSEEPIDLRKSAVQVIETERPVELKKGKEDKHTEVRKTLHEMSSRGNIDFTELGRQIRG